MTASAPEQQWAWLARIRRPQGRKGEVFADILTDFPEKFADRSHLWLLADPDSPRPRTGTSSSPSLPHATELRAHWLHKGGIVLHFVGCDGITAAESLAGLIVAIPLDQRAPLSEDEIYIADLAGCTLFDVSDNDPSEVGLIEDVDRNAGPVALLVVKSSHSQEEVLVPFAKSYLRLVDINARRVEMALPSGLIDLNSPTKS